MLLKEVLDSIRSNGPQSIFMVRDKRLYGKITLVGFILIYSYGVLKNTGTTLAKQTYVVAIGNSISKDNDAIKTKLANELVQIYNRAQNDSAYQAQLLDIKNKELNAKFFAPFFISYCGDEDNGPNINWTNDVKLFDKLFTLAVNPDKALNAKLCKFVLDNYSEREIINVFNPYNDRFNKNWLLPTYAATRISNGFLCGFYHLVTDIHIFPSYFEYKAAEACTYS